MTEDYFPQGIAQGSAFLGREKELKDLTYNIQSGHHTLIFGSRRIGKTSLVKRALENLNIPFGETNFFISQTQRSVELKIMETIRSVTHLLIHNEKEASLILSKLAAYFSKAKKKWSFGIKGLAGVEITPETDDDIPENILVGLNFLESLLADFNQKAVLFFDEIQEINHIENGFALQGAIREFAQHSKQLVFIFSGSNRHLLSHMFDDRSMPLYELCERLSLGKINQELYINYINQIALKTKGGALLSSTLDQLFLLTDLHPKRVYNLCFQLWKDYENNKITPEQVEKSWNELLEKQSDVIRSQLKKLNSGCLKTLTLIAEISSDGNSTDCPITGKIAQRKIGISSASISNALKILEEEDLIFKEEGNYCLVDPLIRSFLFQYERHNLAP